MKNVSNEFINLSKKIKIQNLNLTINDGELTVQEVHFMPVNLFNAIPVSRLKARKEVITKELTYSFEGELFKTIMQQIEITVKNASEIKGKNVDFKYGILVNNDFEYVDMGEYYIKDVEDDKNKEELVVTGYDKMLNFMRQFKQSELKLTYPCKMKQLVSKMGEVCGVELYSTDFYNSDLTVDEDFFTAQELTYRDVLEKVAQTTLTTIFIKKNKLYLCKIGDSVQTLDTSFLSNLVIGEKFGPVNALVLGRGSVEDNIESVNQQSIDTNGRCEIRFDENEFVDSKREQMIDGMLEQIKGLECYSIEASNLGILWLEPCDVIIAKDREENEYKTIYLKAKVTINTGISGEMEANIPKTTTTEYKVTTKEERKTLKVERLAKKNEGLIKDIIEETDKNSEKLSKHEQTIDSMKDTLKSQETKIETVENKADTAQSTANTATTKANNAQKTADSNTTKITTTTTKLAEVEKTVDGITQSVSAVEEKVETVETKADNAQSTANTAKTTADNTNKNLTTNYYTKTETNSQIQAKADSITTSVTKEISTAKSEAINSANSSTNNKLKDYTVTSKLGTFIEQNYEHVKLAWNQISEFIQMMIINNNASFAILDKNKEVMMALDKKGQHFYDNGKVFGEMGVKTLENSRYIAFSVDGEYGQSTNDGMAWGVTTKSDNKFFPILFLENFQIAQKDAGDYGGELVLTACDLVLQGIGTGIISGNVKMYGNDLTNGLIFEDTTTNETLLEIIPEGSPLYTYPRIRFLDGAIDFFRNQAGSNTFKIGSSIFTDEDTLIIGTDDNVGSITVHGNVYANNISSDKRIKDNIEDSNVSALELVMKIKHKQFDKKDDKKHYDIGYIAQDMEKIDPNFVLKREKTEYEEERYYINELPIIATLSKAIQEQQKTIEELTKRIEVLEKGVNNE